MKNIVIFGTNDLAELAWYYFQLEYEPFCGKCEQVVAFTKNKEFCDKNIFKSLPIIPFEEIENIYPPSTHYLFASH